MVENEADPDDMVVIAPDFLATTFNTYFHGGQAQIAFPWTMDRLEEVNCVGWNDRWYRAAEAVPATLDVINSQLESGDKVWLIAALDEYPDEKQYYEQVRRLKDEMETHYKLLEVRNGFRNAGEWADLFVFEVP